MVVRHSRSSRCASSGCAPCRLPRYARTARGRVYPNFPDPALDDWAAANHAGNYPRLAAVKNAYDPHRFFDFPQAI